jgi:hypothetical protein
MAKVTQILPPHHFSLSSFAKGLPPLSPLIETGVCLEHLADVSKVMPW